MIRHIKKSEYKKTRWKNGQGFTEEIYIYPEAANFFEDKFVFRLSTATIQSENEFSQFPGYERILTVIDGKGLVLNDEPLLLNDIIQFSGWKSIKCTPYTSQTIDLGLIFDEKIIAAEMTRLQFGDLRLELDQSKEYFLFCGEGLIFYGSLMVQRFDTLHLKGEESVHVSSPDVIAFLITVTFKL